MLAAGSNTARCAIAKFHYRVALLHHHILPLPDRPPEWSEGTKQKIEKLIFDEAFKLCDNAGLITDFLLQSRIHLVLHGHQHKTFAANIRYLDHDAAAGHVMAVVGGPAARDGFEAVRFEDLGHVELDRYAMSAGTKFVLRGSYPLWSYADWKRGEWDGERRRLGWYQHADLRARLDVNGDYYTTRDITRIYGGDMAPVREIPISAQVGNREVAVTALIDVRDKSKPTSEPRSGLPAADYKVEYAIRLDPPATVREPHPGYRFRRISKNAFALTAEEASLVQTPARRDARIPNESIEFASVRPTERFTACLQFPSGFVPQNLTVAAKCTADGEFDPAETALANRRLLFDREMAIAVLDTDHYLPSHAYELKWDLPSLELTAAQSAQAALAQRAASRLSAACRNARGHVNDQLDQVRRKCLAQLQCDPAGTELGLWLFERESGQLRCVAGTHPPDSKLWTATLPWGAGFQGMAMRRGCLEYFVRSEERNRVFHRSLDGAREEAYLLCAPIPLPVGVQFPEGPVEFCRLIFCLSSCEMGSELYKFRDKEKLSKLASYIFYEIAELIRPLQV